MVREPIRHGDGGCLIRNSLNDITDLQVILAVAVRRFPLWRDILPPKKRHKRIVIRFGNFMAQAGNVQGRRIHEDWLVPRRVVQDKSSGQISIVGIAALKIERVKPPDAAGAALCSRDEQISWWKKE